MQAGATLGVGLRSCAPGSLFPLDDAPGAALWEPEGCVSHGRGCALSGGCTWVQGAMPGQVVALTKGFGVWFPR